MCKLFIINTIEMNFTKIDLLKNFDKILKNLNKKFYT